MARSPRPRRGRRKDLEWYDGAACRGMDTRLFFPERGDQGVPARIARLCHSCPVLEDCRSSVLARPSELGIWGGWTQEERQRMRRRARRRAS